MYKMREDIYNFVDSFVKLVYVMMKLFGEANRLKMLRTVLITVKAVLQKDHDTKKTQFLVLPYHRFFAILFQEVTAEPMPYEKLLPILKVFWLVSCLSLIFTESFNLNRLSHTENIHPNLNAPQQTCTQMSHFLTPVSHQ